MQQIISTHNDTSLKLALCIDRNTAVLESCSFELRRFAQASAKVVSHAKSNDFFKGLKKAHEGP